MKKYLMISFLLISFIYVRLYPYINHCTDLKDNKVQTLEELLTYSTHETKTDYNLPQIVSVGAVGIGEIATGFTLAEVLITLLIIGVVSSLVIPALIQDSQEAELKTAWKKSYADLSQVTTNLLNDNAGDFTGVFTSTDILRDNYLQYLNYSKKCNYGTNTAGNCWVKDGVTKLLNGNGFPYSSTFTSGVILSNGVLLKFEMNDTSSVNCVKAAWFTTLLKCAIIHVDVNGFKGPNTLGKDVYLVQLLRNGIKPVGTKGDDREASCNPTSGGYSGYGCAAQYLYQ